MEGTRYGVSTTAKDYYLIAKRGLGVTVTPAPKSKAAKAAKATKELGEAISICQGKKKIPTKTAEKRTGFKVVRRTEDGFASVFDESPWVIGKKRSEKATPDHTGGYYYFAALDEALASLENKNTFPCQTDGILLSILAVEASGAEYAHGTKLCASKIKPVQEVLALI